MEVVEKQRELEVLSNEDNLLQVENFIDQIVDEFNIKPEVYGKINVAVTEAVKNAIIHGNKLQLQKKVVISCEISKRKLNICVKDEGNGFDYKKTPDPSELSDDDEESGQGIYLMKYLSDQIEFKQKGSVVCLTFII